MLHKCRAFLTFHLHGKLPDVAHLVALNIVHEQLAVTFQMIMSVGKDHLSKW